VARHVHRIGEDHVVAQLAIVGDVGVGHQQAVAPDGGAAGGGRPAVECRELSNDGAVSDLEAGPLPLELEVLGIRPEHRPVGDLAVLAQVGVTLDRHPRTDLGPVPDTDPRPDHGPRPNHHAFPELDVGIDDRGRMNACLTARPDSRLAHLSTILAMNSASATRFSSTNPSPLILHVCLLSWTISNSKTRVSPGVTGRRHFTLSMVMKYTTFFSGSSTSSMRRSPPTWAIASMIRTPGMIG